MPTRHSTKTTPLDSTVHDARPRKTMGKAMAEARLLRLRRQNEKLALELGKTREQLVPIADFQREVARANSIVKSRLLALPNQLAPQVEFMPAVEAADLIRRAIVEVLNDLAYEGVQNDAATTLAKKKSNEKQEDDYGDEDEDDQEGFEDPDGDRD